MSEMTDRMSEDMLDKMSEDTPNRMPDRISEDMPDRMSEDMIKGSLEVQSSVLRMFTSQVNDSYSKG